MANRNLSASTSALLSSQSLWAPLGQTLGDWVSDLDAVIDTVYRPTSKRFGAKGTAIKITDAATTVGSNVITSASANFKAADIGKYISVVGAGLTLNGNSYVARSGFTNNALTGVITAVNSATSVSISKAADGVTAVNATAAVTNAIAAIGFDDTASIQKAIEAIGVRGGGAVDLGGRTYLVRDVMEINWDYTGVQNGRLLVIDSPSIVNGGTTFQGGTVNHNWTSYGAFAINVRTSIDYTGPAFPTGRGYSRSYPSFKDSEWMTGNFIRNMVIDLDCVSFGFGGSSSAGGYPSGVQNIRGPGCTIGAGLCSNLRILNNRLINSQTGGISAAFCFDTIIDSNTLEGFRSFPSSNGDVWGGNGIQAFSTYNGAVITTTKERGANRITNNVLVGSMSQTWPDAFIISGQNTVFSGNIGIDVQTGDRPYGAPAPWTANTAYAVNDRVNVSGTPYVCTVAGTSGTTGPSSSYTTSVQTDNTVTWAYAAPATSWQPGTSYAVGRRASFNGNTYEATTAGTSVAAAIVPWTTATAYAVGAVVTSGAYYYRCVAAITSSTTAPTTQSAALNDGGVTGAWTWIGKITDFSSTPGPTGTGSSIPDGTVVWKFAACAPTWGPSQTYTAGTKVLWGDKTYLCVLGGTSSPAYNNWTVSTAYTAGQIMAANGNVYFCTTSGTSAATGTGPTTLVNNIADGTAVWVWMHPIRELGGTAPWVQDGSCVWQSVTSYQRQIPQNIISGNTVRKWEFGIMAEGQRQGGAGDVIITNNDVSDIVLNGIHFYSDLQDYSATPSGNVGVAGFNNAYSVVVSGNKLNRCWTSGVRIDGTNFLVTSNVITDWGSTSSPIYKLGYLPTYNNVAAAIAVSPSTPGLASVISCGGVIANNDCRIVNPIDQVLNPFYQVGIKVTTLITTQVARGLIIEGNRFDFNGQYRVKAPDWLAGTTYSVGQNVTSGAQIYTCVAGGIAATAPNNGANYAGATTPSTNDANGVQWVWALSAPVYSSNHFALIIQGMWEDVLIANNIFQRFPSAAMDFNSLKTTNPRILGPSRVTVRGNKMVDGGMAGSQSAAINLNTQRPGWIFENNEYYETSTALRLARFIASFQEVSNVDNTIDDIVIRNNKVKNLSQSPDLNTIAIASSGTNIKIENNDSYNYVTSCPSLTLSAGLNLFAGTIFWSKNPTPGTPLGWVVQASGRLSLTNWTTGTAYTANTYVNSNGNVYRCTTAGTAGATAPSGTSASVSDGGATWAYFSAQPTIQAFDVLPAYKTGVTAAGTTQAGATALVVGINIISSVPATTAGVVLPQGIVGPAGMPTPGTTGTTTGITVINQDPTNSVLIYPATGGKINALATNAAYTLAAGAMVTFRAVASTITTTTTTQYYV